MRELDVRTAVLAQLREQYRSDHRTRILNEFAVGGGAGRIDVAVVNGRMLGIEIKSDADTLDRLPAQAAIYNGVFDRVTIVCGSRHSSKVHAIVPEWWGIAEAKQSDGCVQLSNVRQGNQNPSADSIQIARLLWRDELLSVLAKHGFAAGLRSKSRERLVTALCQKLELSNLQFEVREHIKSRLKWRVDEQHALCGDSFQLAAKPSDCRAPQNQVHNCRCICLPNCTPCQNTLGD